MELVEYNIPHFNDMHGTDWDRLILNMRSDSYKLLINQLDTSLDFFDIPNTNYIIFYNNHVMYLLGLKKDDNRVGFWHVTSPSEMKSIYSMPLSRLKLHAYFNIDGVCTAPIEQIQEWKKATIGRQYAG